jgi:hypothetical protein
MSAHGRTEAGAAGPTPAASNCLNVWILWRGACKATKRPGANSQQAANWQPAKWIMECWLEASMGCRVKGCSKGRRTSTQGLPNARSATSQRLTRPARARRHAPPGVYQAHQTRQALSGAGPPRPQVATVAASAAGPAGTPRASAGGKSYDASKLQNPPSTTAAKAQTTVDLTFSPAQCTRRTTGHAPSHPPARDPRFQRNTMCPRITVANDHYFSHVRY